MNDYFNNNKLANNIEKTNVMIIYKKNNVKKEQIEINGITIKHNDKMRMLGMVFNSSLNWSNNNDDKNGLIEELKKRKSAVIKIAKILSNKFALQFANALFISKCGTLRQWY